MKRRQVSEGPGAMPMGPFQWGRPQEADPYPHDNEPLNPSSPWNHHHLGGRRAPGPESGCGCPCRPDPGSPVRAAIPARRGLRPGGETAHRDGRGSEGCRSTPLCTCPLRAARANDNRLRPARAACTGRIVSGAGERREMSAKSAMRESLPPDFQRLIPTPGRRSEHQIPMSREIANCCCLSWTAGIEAREKNIGSQRSQRDRYG